MPGSAQASLWRVPDTEQGLCYERQALIQLLWAITVDYVPQDAPC